MFVCKFFKFADFYSLLCVCWAWPSLVSLLHPLPYSLFRLLLRRSCFSCVSLMNIFMQTSSGCISLESKPCFQLGVLLWVNRVRLSPPRPSFPEDGTKRYPSPPPKKNQDAGGGGCVCEREFCVSHVKDRH